MILVIMIIMIMLSVSKHTAPKCAFNHPINCQVSCACAVIKYLIKLSTSLLLSSLLSFRSHLDLTCLLSTVYSKSKNNWQDYWKTLKYEGWVDEFGGQKKILAKYASIPEADIKGARAPNLQTAGNVTIAVSFFKIKFFKDSHSNLNIF